MNLWKINFTQFSLPNHCMKILWWAQFQVCQSCWFELQILSPFHRGKSCLKSISKYWGGGLAMNVSPVTMNNSAPQIRQPRCIHSNRFKLALSPQGCSQHLQPLSNCYQVERLPASCQIWTDLHPTQALFSKCFRQGGKASSPLYPGVLYKAGKALARSNRSGIYGNWASQESNEKILEIHWICSSYKSAIF